MIVLMVPEAQAEFFDAIAYYAEAGESLGRRFKEETTRCINWIAVNHESFRLRPGGYRRINLKIFPYGLPFVVRGEILWVLAVAHAARKPEYWIERRPGV